MRRVQEISQTPCLEFWDHLVLWGVHFSEEEIPQNDIQAIFVLVFPGTLFLLLAVHSPLLCAARCERQYSWLFFCNIMTSKSSEIEVGKNGNRVRLKSKRALRWYSHHSSDKEYSEKIFLLIKLNKPLKPIGLSKKCFAKKRLVFHGFWKVDL